MDSREPRPTLRARRQFVKSGLVVNRPNARGGVKRFGGGEVGH